MTAIEIIKADLEKKNELEKYVILKKDEQGFYIEYAFKEGAPHDNRCLDWYNSYQEEAYIRNGWVKGLDEKEKRARLNSIKAERESRVGKVYRLYSFTCGGEENPEEQIARRKESFEKYHADSTEPFVPEENICKVGCPMKSCDWIKYGQWSYDLPVKCACWHLEKGVTMDEFIENYNIPMKATEVAELMNK